MGDDLLSISSPLPASTSPTPRYKGGVSVGVCCLNSYRLVLRFPEYRPMPQGAEALGPGLGGEETSGGWVVYDRTDSNGEGSSTLLTFLSKSLKENGL